MAVDIKRSLQHVSGVSLEDVEAQIFKLNLLGQISIEVFQVQKIQGRWYAHFNLDAMKFKELTKLLSRNAAPEVVPSDTELPKVKRNKKRGTRTV